MVAARLYGEKARALILDAFVRRREGLPRDFGGIRVAKGSVVQGSAQVRASVLTALRMSARPRASPRSASVRSAPRSQ